MAGAFSTIVMIDRTHLGRRASGIERITRELFSAEALAPVVVDGVNGSAGKLSLIANQMLRLPALALLHRGTIWAFPGYPPSPLFGLLRDRSILYVHDLFLMTRREDLNRSAKFYMAWPFKKAIGSFRYFLVNSDVTRRTLAPHVPMDATILHYRPRVKNVFGLTSQPPKPQGGPLLVGAIGTIEPRKNFLAAAAICQLLEQVLKRPVELHIIGRPGWGPDVAALRTMPGVRLHGFIADDAMRSIIEMFDFIISTSHDEGLGLPLLETQYAGLPVVAPDQDVFREVLGDSGVFIDPSDKEKAVRVIASIFDDPDWRQRHAVAAADNITRWNAQAEVDRQNVIAFLTDLGRALAQAGA